MKNLIISAAFVFAVALGCGGTKDDACTGKVSFEGKTFEGKGADAEKSRQNACNMYCREADKEYEAKYRIWLDSPKGKAAGSPSKQEAIFKDKELMEFVTVTCANRCVRDMKPESSCK